MARSGEKLISAVYRVLGPVKAARSGGKGGRELPDSAVEEELRRAYGRGAINDQGTAGSAVSRLRLGARYMDYNGCEVIAVYNALVLLDAYRPLTELSRYFEGHLLLRGEWGVNCFALATFFRSMGYCVTESSRQTEFDAILAGSGVGVLSYWNLPRLRGGVHTVALRLMTDGTVTAYNLNGRARSFGSVEALLSGTGEALAFIGIR